jgi:hypothetical protein
LEKNTFYTYDINRLNDYKKKGMRSVLFIYIFIIIYLPVLYLQIKDFGNSLLIISMTFFMCIISGCIGILIGRKKAKKEYESYQIECNDQYIIIKSSMQSKKINISKINKILKDNKNNFYIYTNRINKIKILNYIENIKEFEEYLKNITEIKQYKTKYNVYDFIPVLFWVILMYVSIIGNIELYLFFAPIVIITTVYSIISFIFDQLKIVYKIIGIIVHCVILFSVINGLILVIKYLLE